MRPQERGEVLDLLESAFHERDLFERYMDHDPAYRSGDLLLALERGRPVSCVQVFEKRIRLGKGAALSLGGIGSVATHPDHRGRGLASELIRRQTGALCRRGAALGLLFTGRHTFYAPLGWVPIALPQAALRPARPLSERPGRVREFEPRDLPRIRWLYDAYCAEIAGTTLRDERYWDGQLRYAGTPGERFTVFERGGALTAYLRCVELGPGRSAMEFARRDDAADGLAALLCEALPEDAPLFLRVPPDGELSSALQELGARLDPLPDRSAMWRVLDREALTAHAPGLRRDAPDEELLRALVEGRRMHYWLADRF